MYSCLVLICCTKDAQQSSLHPIAFCCSENPPPQIPHHSNIHLHFMYYPTIHMHILLHLIYPPFTSMAYGYIKYSITTNPHVHEVFGILAPRFKTPTSVDDEFSVKPSRESIFQQCTKQSTKKLTCSPHHVHNFSVMFRLENQTLRFLFFCFQKTPPKLSVRFH